MFKTFDRYILKEISVPFGIGLSVYTLSLLINQILRLSHTLVQKGASLGKVLEILVFLLPDFMSFTIPMSTLMGVLAGISRLSTDSEITAFKTMGISNWRILRPVMVFSFIMWLVSSILIMFVVPETNYKLKMINADIGFSQAVKSIRSKSFYDQFAGYILYFEDIDKNSDEWVNVFLYFREGGDKDKIILAKRGMIIQQDPKKKRSQNSISRKETVINLKDATIISFNRKDPEKDNQIVFYSSFRRNITGSTQEIKIMRGGSQFPIGDLIKEIDRVKKLNTRGAKLTLLNLNIEFHNKFSLPFACLAFGILGLSLGISTKKGGKISGFIFSLGIIFLYYSITVLFRNLINQGSVSASIGMWLPVITLTVIGIVLFIKSSKEKSVDLDWLFNRIEKIKGLYQRRKRNVLFILKIKRFNFKLLKIIDLYIIKKLIFVFMFIFVSIVMIFFIINFIELADDAVENNIGFTVVLEYVLYSMTDFLSFIFPVSILTSVLLVFSIMSKNNELIAVQVSGISLYRVVVPAIFFGALISAIAFYIQENVTPDASKKALVLYNKIHKQNRKIDAELHRNWVAGDPGTFYFYQNFNKQKKSFYKFGILEIDPSFNIKRRVFAKYAKWIDNQSLQLMDGFEKRYIENNPQPINRFGPYIFNTYIRESDFIKKASKLGGIFRLLNGFGAYSIELVGRRFVYFDHYQQDDKRFDNIKIVFFNGDYKVEKIIHADHARWEGLTEIVLNQSRIQIFSKNASPYSQSVAPPKEIQLVQGQGLFKKRVVSSLLFMNIKDLKEYIQYLKQTNTATTRYEAKLYYKYAFPLSSLLMVILAIPFSFLMGKKGAVYGIGIAVGFSMIYWGAFGIFSALGSTALLSPFISAFGPIILFSSVSLYMFINIKT